MCPAPGGIGIHDLFFWMKGYIARSRPPFVVEGGNNQG